ncbi:MAG: DUF3881 family protein [Lachnospiraceae bacterium]|nr:DUF3881 family protein [Lachnospiraceae bacterium]
MHKYLRAVGFSKLSDREQYDELIKNIALDATDRVYTSYNDKYMIAMYTKDYAPGVGISVVGVFDENNRFFFEYAYPYVRGNNVSSYEDISVERHSDKESYAGVCDEARLGVSLIFYIQNVVPYIRVKNAGLLPIRGTSVTLSALSLEGTIVMPLAKSEDSRAQAIKSGTERMKLVEAARRGDGSALESLTLNDLDTYSAVSRKIVTEDVFTLVDTYFMPYGAECDLYSILGEILLIENLTNSLTGDELVKLTLVCNEIILDICINKQDLYGEPAIGRRFKGIIWLQGNINYPNPS